MLIYKRQGTSEFPVYAFQESQCGLRRANKDLGGPIRIEEGQYRVSRANTEPAMGFRKDNTKLPMHFRRANADPY